MSASVSVVTIRRVELAISGGVAMVRKSGEAARG